MTSAALHPHGHGLTRQEMLGRGGRRAFVLDDAIGQLGYAIGGDGYLLNAAGGPVEGLPVCAKTGRLLGDGHSPVRLRQILPPRKTSQIFYQVNLPGYPLTAAAAPDCPASGLLNTAGFFSDPAIKGGGVISAGDAAAFLDQSIAGGSLTLYDRLGSPVTLRLRWAKLESLLRGGRDRWNLFYLVRGNALGREIAWRNAGQDYFFSGGRLAAPLPKHLLGDATIEGARLGGIFLSHGVKGVTQFADAAGIVKTKLLSQDGYAQGELTGIPAASSGQPVLTYSNGCSFLLTGLAPAA